MSPDPTAEDQPEPTVEFVAGPRADGPHEVELVVPAPVCDAIDTEADRSGEPSPPDVDAVPVPMPVIAPPPDGAVVAAVKDLGQALGRKLDGLQALFEREVRAEATREKIVDRLHAELQEYKQDLLLNTLRPVFLDLIQLHDDIGKMIDVSGDAEGEVARLLGVLRGFQQGIEDILYRQGVEPFGVEGEGFDPRRQRAVSTVPSDDPGQAKTVASRLRKGFRAGERIIRPEIVSVFAAPRVRPGVGGESLDTA